ncbi:hypothetical protein JCM21900_006117 [Sporobolomyces salmonicolor]
MAFALHSSLSYLQARTFVRFNNGAEVKSPESPALPRVTRRAIGQANLCIKQEAAASTRSRSSRPPTSVTPGYVLLAVLLGLDSCFLDESQYFNEAYARGEFSNETGDRVLVHDLKSIIYWELLPNQDSRSRTSERIERCLPSLPPSSPTLSESPSFTSSSASISRQSSFYSTRLSLGSPRSTSTAGSFIAPAIFAFEPLPFPRHHTSPLRTLACSPFPLAPFLNRVPFPSYALDALRLLSRAPPIATDYSPRHVKSHDEPPRQSRKLRNAAEYDRRRRRAHEKRCRKRQERLERTEYFCSGARTPDYMMRMSCEDEDDE